MSSLREQIDRLDPETYAREALAAARSAKRRAEAAGLLVPAPILELLEIPEPELARQRANAIAATASQTPTKTDSQPADQMSTETKAGNHDEDSEKSSVENLLGQIVAGFEAPKPNPLANSQSPWPPHIQGYGFPAISGIPGAPSTLHPRLLDQIWRSTARSSIDFDSVAGAQDVRDAMRSAISENIIPGPALSIINIEIAGNWTTSLRNKFNIGDTIKVRLTTHHVGSADTAEFFQGSVMEHAYVGEPGERFSIRDSSLGRDVIVTVRVNQPSQSVEVEVIANRVGHSSISQ